MYLLYAKTIIVHITVNALNPILIALIFIDWHVHVSNRNNNFCLFTCYINHNYYFVIHGVTAVGIANFSGTGCGNVYFKQVPWLFQLQYD